MQKIKQKKYCKWFLLFITIQFCLCATCVNMVFCQETSDSSVTLELSFQKISNNEQTESEQDSDLFNPLDTIEIYAKVEFEGLDQKGVLVSFEINGPENSSHPYSVYRTAKTDQAGIASISFTVPPENSTIAIEGAWNIYSTTKILGETDYDTKSFEVQLSNTIQTRELFIILLVATAVSTTTPLAILAKKSRVKKTNGVVEKQTMVTGTPVVAPVDVSIIETIESLEKEKALTIAEIKQLKTIANKKAAKLQKEVAELQKQVKKLRKYKEN